LKAEPEHNDLLLSDLARPAEARLRDAWTVTVLVHGGLLRASTVLARCGREVALFDTGLAQHAASLLLALAHEGLGPDDVTCVFNTHAHVDHSHNNVLFPRARIYCSAHDREWTRQLHVALTRVTRPTEHDLLPFYPEVVSGGYDPAVIRKVLALQNLVWDQSRWGDPANTVWLEDHVPPDGITVVDTPGHSPHHVSFVIAASRRVLVCGDALMLAGEDRVTVQLMPPCDLATYHRSRERISTFDGIIVPGHGEPYDNRATGGAIDPARTKNEAVCSFGSRSEQNVESP